MSILKKTLTIAAGSSNSAAINLRAVNSDEGVAAQGKTLLGVILPSAMTGATISVQGSLDGTNFYAVQDNSGTDLSLTFSASKWRTLDPTIFAAIPIVRFVSSGTEASSRDLIAVVRDV